jgi:hypothetical protein
MIQKQVFFWDLETLDIFTATFIAKDSDYCRVFVLSSTVNQIQEMIDFIDSEVSYLVGYNSIHFDAQVLEYIYRNPTCNAQNIRKYAYLITDDNNRRPDIPEWKLRHKHLDLFRALSLSVKAKRIGLKWTEFMIDFLNIEDLPSQGTSDNWAEMILSYNKNDVLATKALYFKYEHEIKLRKSLTELEGVNLMNSTEPDIAKKLFSKYLCKAMGILPSDLSTLYTNRDVVKIKDIILPYVEFKTSKLHYVLKEFEKLELKESDKFDFKINIYGIEWSFALGGLHASIQNSIVESNDEYIIKSLDVVSYYPNLAIRNKWSPAHLPQEIFCPLYESFFERRKAIPKTNPANYAFKILLNSAYGMSNDKYSFLRDRQLTLSICINGQLLLAMLIERLMIAIPDAQLLVINTDGCEIRIPRKYEQLYHQICSEWEKTTQLQLEFAEYSKMVQKDVNSYTAFYTNGKHKCKGSFEFENIPLHKNKSHNIIPIAIFNYFKNRVSVEQTVLNHENIFDFCAGVKASRGKSFDSEDSKRGASHYELRWLENSELKKRKLSKTVRYFISKKGYSLVKCYENGTEEFVEAPIKEGKIRKFWHVTYFNNYYEVDDFKDYDIDYLYYIIKAKEIIAEFENEEQLNLF